MIAALILACCEQPEYEESSFGVISMVGEEQALAVDKVLLKNMELTEYQERRIVCGNAAQFQGDERDVIFLSLVEHSEDGSPLSLRTAETFVKRFNVAASRARDQMWAVRRYVHNSVSFNRVGRDLATLSPYDFVVSALAGGDCESIRKALRKKGRCG